MTYFILQAYGEDRSTWMKIMKRKDILWFWIIDRISLEISEVKGHKTKKFKVITYRTIFIVTLILKWATFIGDRGMSSETVVTRTVLTRCVFFFSFWKNTLLFFSLSFRCFLLMLTVSFYVSSARNFLKTRYPPSKIVRMSHNTNLWK